MKNTLPKLTLGLLALALLVLPSPYADAEKIGKNPGQTKGRWLEVGDAEELGKYTAVYIGDVASDIQWKKKEKESPIDEELLNDKIREHLLMRLNATPVFSQVLDSPPAEGEPGVVRLDCDLIVEPGNRAIRYVAGFGAGKSKSILEIHLRDHQTGKDLGLYHGYGVGTGMGFKVVGGGARKMTQDDIQENAKKFVELLAQIM